MDASKLLDKLEENAEDNIITVLSALGHEDIRDRGKYIQCSNIDGDNRSAISILKEGLLYQNFTRGRKGNIITLVMDERDCNFPEALEWLAKTIGYKEVPIHYPFGGFYRTLYQSKNYESDLPTYPESALPPPDALPQMWFNDGVDYLTQERFGIRIDFDSNRIVIPARNYNGELVGAKGRYNGDCPMDERWSMYIPYAKSQVLYGWKENHEKIVKKQRVYIVEAEKSVCQAASWDFNLMLAVGGHDISEVQARRIKSLGVDVVIAFDQGIARDVLLEQCDKVRIDNQFFRNRVGYIDMSGMPNKVSPTDMGMEKFLELNGRIVWTTG